MVYTTKSTKRPAFIPVTELEQDAFCQEDPQLRTLRLAEEFQRGVRWQSIPDYYTGLDQKAIDDGIKAVLARIGNKVFILGHHYQRDDVIKYADVIGDSYLLSLIASERKQAEYIIFCGVQFMAETADILTSSEQKVILPNLMAGCSMADMAPTDLVEDAWEDLTDVLAHETAKAPILPVTYMNSGATIKALCGRTGGLVCTSSNAKRAFEWAFERGERIFFLPDKHLGYNTAMRLGIDKQDIVVWNPFKPLGGLSTEKIKQAKVILWQGFCSVHTRFSVKQIDDVRAKNPDVNVIVHPECTSGVVEAADFVGSTEYIKKMIEDAPPGSAWAVGTEISMVKRLGNENPDKKVFCLDSRICPCTTMFRVHPAYLLWVLECLEMGIVQNQIKVEPDTKQYAAIALQRMLEISK